MYNYNNILTKSELLIILKIKLKQLLYVKEFWIILLTINKSIAMALKMFEKYSYLITVSD